MAKKTVQDKMIERFKVKVIKTSPDDRSSLCGEPMQKDADGTQYFLIPGHQADYINRMFPNYQVSEPFIPGVDLESALEMQEKPEPEQAQGIPASFLNVVDGIRVGRKQ
jgi:hypothetical protein